MTKTPSEIVRDSQEKVIAAGGRRIKALVHKEAADAIDHLLSENYAESTAACVSKAVIEASDRISRSKRK
jgi:hypothetical protein